MPASRRSRNSSTTSSSSSLPGLAPLPLRPNFPDVFCKSGRKERPALVVPRFDLIGLPQLFRGKTVSPPRWERPASSPSSLRLSGGGSARLGTRHPRRRRRRRSEKLSRDGEQSNPPRDLSASFQFSDVSSAPSRKLTSRRLDGREGGGGLRLDCSRKPASSQILPPFFFDTVMRMDSRRDPTGGFLFVEGILCRVRSIRWPFRRNFYFGRRFFGYGVNFNLWERF